MSRSLNKLKTDHLLIKPTLNNTGQHQNTAVLTLYVFVTAAAGRY